MAPIKRSLNGETLVQEENESRKRVRISENFESSDDSDDESEGEFDDSELITRGTQFLREKFARLGDNVPAENGIIERVECYNFMCHEKFGVDLGPLINFVVGKNGSGKSAVLTALTLCLGAKASATNRGQSLKKFIKEGKDTATIIVRIKNMGATAYQHQQYGDYITVERSFGRNGSSGFKIKNTAGTTVTTRKSDLDSITDYFSLQMDNPMNVLSQDMARQFLSSSTPFEKYKFFVKGVQLEQLDQDYRMIEEKTDQLLDKLETRREDIGPLEAKRDEAKRLLDASERQESLLNRVRSLRVQFAWAQVEEQEGVLEACTETVTAAAQKVAELESDVGRADQAFQAADEEHEAAQRAIQDANAVLNDHLDGKQSVKDRYDAAVNERHELKAQQRTISEHLKAAEERIRDTQRRIDDETQRLANLDGGSNAQKAAELAQKEASAAELRARYNAKKRDREQILENIEKAEEVFKARRAPIPKKQEEVQQARNRLRDLMRDRGRQQNGFSDRMPMLLRAIENESSFSRRPIGPLGNHVRLLKPQWSPILENTLGTTLSSFVVTSKRDMNILSKLMQKVDCVCPIIIGNDAGPLDTSLHEPDARFDTALRVLEIDNELVRRQLVINHGIEQMLLIADLEEASRTLFDGDRPKNVRRCFCIDKRDKRRGIHLAFNRAGEPTQSPVSAYNGHPRMKTDTETQIRMQQDVVDNLEQQLQELMQQCRQAESHLSNCRQSLGLHDHQESELKVGTQRADDLLEELKDEISRNTMNDGNLHGLKSSLADIEEEKRLNEASYVDSVNAMDSVVERIKAIKRELAEKDAEIAPLQENIRVLQENENRIAEKRKNALGQKNIVIGKLENAKSEERAAEQQRREVEARVNDYIEKATLVSPRVSIDPGETVTSLDKKHSRLREQLQQYNQQIGKSRDELQRVYTEAEENYQRAQVQIDKFEDQAQQLKHSLGERKERWKKFRSHITARAMLQFTYLLSERSFRGKIVVHHEEKFLDLQVEPDITKDSAGRGARTLSGGEKSFSQICLLLALWEAMGSPVRCLDEFDVYMDSVNRRMSIEMLMTAARRSVGRQFILITPGSRADIKLAPDVRVNELAEPERGQRTLPFEMNRRHITQYCP